MIRGAIIEKRSTVGFPPSLSKDNRKLNIEYYHFLFMEHTKYFRSVSKEGESMVLKEKKMHVWGSILSCFWAWEPPRGRPGNHAEIKTPKKQEKTLFQEPFFGA